MNIKEANKILSNLSRHRRRTPTLSGGSQFMVLWTNIRRAVYSLVSEDALPSVNWRNGEPYNYCPECGREEPAGTNETPVSGDTPEQIKRRQFQEVEYSPDIEFVLLRKQIALRMYAAYVKDCADERGETFLYWLDKESEG